MGDARQERPGVPKRDANLTLAGSHCREKCLFWRTYASRTSILSGLLTSVERHRNRQHSTGGGKLCGCAAGENNRPIKPPVKRWHARARPHTTVREKCLSVGNLRGRMRPLFMLHGQSKGNGAVQNDREYVVVMPGDEDAFAPRGRYARCLAADTASSSRCSNSERLDAVIVIGVSVFGVIVLSRLGVGAALRVQAV